MTVNRQSLEDGTWFNLESADAFKEATYWDGHNHISRATGSQWDHETLYRTAKGAWVLNQWSQRQGTPETYRRASLIDAQTWLAKNNHLDKLTTDELAELEV